MIVVASIYEIRENTIRTIQQSGVYKMITRWSHPVAPAPENIELGIRQQDQDEQGNRQQQLHEQEQQHQLDIGQPQQHQNISATSWNKVKASIRIIT